MQKAMRLVGVVVGALLALAPRVGSAGPNGNVLSSNIRDADGTTGQDTTRGSGVKTGHLQNGAVTAPKLAPASVGAAAIADGAVTGAKLGSGAVTSGKLAAGAVGTDALADGSVTDAKIVGPIAASKIAGLADYQQRLTHVVTVSLDGRGDFASIAQALASVTDASASNPYLVLVGPGAYDVGTAGVLLGTGVTLAGMGATVTTVTGSPSSGGVINVSGGSAVRDLTVKADSSAIPGAAYPIGISYGFYANYAPGDGSVEIDRVVVDARGCGAEGIHVEGLNVIAANIRDARISAVSTCPLGLPANGVAAKANANITNSIISAPGGTAVLAHDVTHGVPNVTVQGCDLDAPDGLAVNVANGVTPDIWMGMSFTKIRSGWLTKGNGSGTFRCFGNHDAEYQPVTCP